MKNKHDGDCSIYACLCNSRPKDGVCTCGFGLEYMRKDGDETHMYSEEKMKKSLMQQMDEWVKPAPIFDK